MLIGYTRPLQVIIVDCKDRNYFALNKIMRRKCLNIQKSHPVKVTLYFVEILISQTSALKSLGVSI